VNGHFRPVDVIVPVYNAIEAVERCLHSVLANTSDDPDVRIVVADDASPDPEMAVLCTRLADAHPRLTIRRRPTNVGFPGNCNESMAEAKGDVVLLNSDTVVPAGWLEPLRRLAHSSTRVGSVTPLTSNGQICSVPVWLTSNTYPPSITVDDLNDVARAVGYGDWIEIPTGVGFCQYFTQPGLQAVGLFDTAMFGRGYGEENDLCLRLRHHGFVNLLCDTVFVHHEGGLSFGESTPERLRVNLARLNARWPGYDGFIARFIDENPLAGVQARFGLELLRRIKPPGKLRILQVLHNPIRSGHIGGTEFHVDDLVSGSDEDHVILSTVDDVPVVQHGDVTGLKPFPITSTAVTTHDWIRPLLSTGIDVIHVHHLAGLGFQRVAALLDGASRCEIPLVFTAHDYFALCPGIQLRDAESGVACRSDVGQACPGCDRVSVELVGGPRDIWRNQWRSLLADCTVVAPSQAAAERHRAVWGSLPRLEVIPHGLERSPVDLSGSTDLAGPDGVSRSMPVKIAVIGYGGAHKGDRELAAIIEHLSGRGFEWHLFGREAPTPTADDPDGGATLREDVVHHGYYQRDQITRLLADGSFTAALTLPNWPETFSYTLSEAWLAGLFVFASDQGAIAERIAATGAGVVLSSDDPAERARLIAETVASPAEMARLAAAARRAGRNHPTVGAMSAAYDRLYRRLAAEHGKQAPATSSTLPYPWSADEKSQLVGMFRSPLPTGD